MSCSPGASRFEFSPEDIAAAVKDKRLLSMEIELSLRCNFSCPYCYAGKDALENELTTGEIRDAITQAKGLGAKKIILLGGEPMIYPDFWAIVDFILDLGLAIELFTNGSVVTADIAKKLFEKKINVILKMNSFDKHLQDRLTGVDGSHAIIRDGLDNLKAAGYGKGGDPFLAVSTIICKQNINELFSFWGWLRDQNIIPYFEMITPQGGAAENDWLYAEPQEVFKLFNNICKLDKEKYGIIWDPQPPLAGAKCMRHLFSCVVTSRGDVYPCVGVNVPVGNIRDRKLSEIIADSEVMGNLRDWKQTIKGPCRDCDKAQECYGCRGAAYQMTGDYLASDPLCWHNEKRLQEIVKLPADAKTLMPHKLPMVFIDTLEKVGERTAMAATTVKEDWLFVDKDGYLDAAAYLELIAQAAAALNGFEELNKKSEGFQGFLLGARKLKIFKKARAGDRIEIALFIYASYGDFGIVKAQVIANCELLAEGEVKIWHKSNG